MPRTITPEDARTMGPAKREAMFAWLHEHHQHEDDVALIIIGRRTATLTIYLKNDEGKHYAAPPDLIEAAKATIEIPAPPRGLF